MFLDVLKSAPDRPRGSLEALKFLPQTAVFEVLGDPGGVKMDPKRPLGPFLERLGLMDASWSGLGGLLERSWAALGPKKRSLERLLAAPRRIPRQFAAILRAKRVPKGSRGGSQIGPRRRFELQTAKPQNFEDA